MQYLEYITYSTKDFFQSWMNRQIFTQKSYWHLQIWVYPWVIWGHLWNFRWTCLEKVFMSWFFVQKYLLPVPFVAYFYLFINNYITKVFFGDCSREIKRGLVLGRKAMRNIDSILKSRDFTLPTKVHLVQFIIFPVVMYRCESWTIKKAEHQRIDVESEAPILWPPDEKSQLIGKYPDARKDWRQEEKVMTENEMVGWHHRFNGHEFEQTPGDSEGQGGLKSCSPWNHRVRHHWVTEQQQTRVFKSINIE